MIRVNRKKKYTPHHDRGEESLSLWGDRYPYIYCSVKGRVIRSTQRRTQKGKVYDKKYIKRSNKLCKKI